MPCKAVRSVAAGPRAATRHDAAAAGRRPSGIVSSSHAVPPRSDEHPEFGSGLIVARDACWRGAVRCMAAAACRDLTMTDGLPLRTTSGLYDAAVRAATSR